MDHYFSEKPKSGLKVKKISQRLLGLNLGFYTSTGVFSKNEIDKGTLVLAENMQVMENDKLLDMGCGIGILGIFAAKAYNARPTLTDINSRAVMLARKNTELNKADATILQGNLYEKIKDRNFDVIVSNLPQNAGKEVCFAIIENAKNHLKKNGTLQIVARPNKGGKTYAKKMEEVFGNSEEIARKSGYCVYLSIN
jgi:16S rRNA (guanine1207-N2)-methyltransferase